MYGENGCGIPPLNRSTNSLNQIASRSGFSLFSTDGVDQFNALFPPLSQYFNRYGNKVVPQVRIFRYLRIFTCIQCSTARLPVDLVYDLAKIHVKSHTSGFPQHQDKAVWFFPSDLLHPSGSLIAGIP